MKKATMKDVTNAYLIIFASFAAFLVNLAGNLDQVSTAEVVYFVSTSILIVFFVYKAYKRDTFDARTIKQLQLLDDHEFELFVGDLMKKSGYKKVKVMPKGPDIGKDIVAYDRHGKKIIVECKKYSDTNKVDRERVMKLHSAMIHEKATRALLVTTSSFASTCAPYAMDKNIQLVDAMKLSSWIKEVS